ncbi:Ankyrin repeat-containing-like protein [Melia azedarach]|uniref:Ankyrin repeat-containing-like protein n=1 Tax=Melia azedarach TaxID=155640 RepID=A0ACC1Y1I9_MELAZ|nr:Ankyrin repeat-containing-like protein [Melia azedarach]
MDTTTQTCVILTPSLHNAAVKGDIEKFRELENITLDQVLTAKGNTILHIHITARPTPEKPNNNILTKMGLRKKSEEVIISGTNFVEDVLEMCPVLLWKANSKDETPLHMAARHGHADMVQVLITECKKPHQNDHPEEGVAAARRMLGMTNKAKDTAIHEAVRYNHVNVVQILSREDPALPYDANNAGETPLYLAAERGYKDVVKHILTCKSPSDHGPMGRTALHAAVINGYAGTTKLLLECKGSLTCKADEKGWLPLHMAAHFGYYHIVKELLNADKSAAYKADNQGKTALHVAAARGEVRVMKELIDSCPGCWELVDNKGCNVFHFALDSGKDSAVKLLLGNPSLGNLVNEKDNQGNTPLLHHAASDYTRMSFISHPKVDKLVFNHENYNAADINRRECPFWPDRDIFLERLSKFKCWKGRRHIVPEGDKKKEEGNVVNYNVKGEKDKIKLEEEWIEKYVKESQDKNEKDEKRLDTWIEKYVKESQDSHLIVATLIATVTFTAGITLPGGYINDKGPDQGISALVLTKNKAFQGFVISNTIAMILSSCAVFISIFVSMMSRTVRSQFLVLSFVLIYYAMIAMVCAFLTGMYAVLYPGRELAISVCCVGIIFFWAIVETCEVPPGLLLKTVGRVRSKFDRIII